MTCGTRMFMLLHFATKKYYCLCYYFILLPKNIIVCVALFCYQKYCCLCKYYCLCYYFILLPKNIFVCVITSFSKKYFCTIWKQSFASEFKFSFFERYFDVDNHTWHEVAYSNNLNYVPPARSGHSMIAVGERLLVYGGGSWNKDKTKWE